MKLFVARGLFICLVLILSACSTTAVPAASPANTETAVPTATTASTETAVPPTGASESSLATIEENNTTTMTDSIETTPGLLPENPTEQTTQVDDALKDVDMDNLKFDKNEALIDQAIQLTAELTGVAPEEINIIKAQSTVWRDGSLGCPQPGMMYTQALVEGTWIVLEADGETIDYRVRQNGSFVLCEDPPKGVSPVSPTTE